MNHTQNKLVEDHLNCVHWTIHSCINVNASVCGLEYDDLFQEGCVALCRAAETYDEQKNTQFHSYAISVIRNHLLDYCRHVQTQSVPKVSLEDEDHAQDIPASWDDDSRLFVDQVLDFGKRRYSGVARLGVEALELKIAGYSGTDIAKLYGVQPNLVGAWISRAAKKLKKDVFLVEVGKANSQKKVSRNWGGFLMNAHTYYTAVGHFQRRTNDQGQSYPVIIINQQEYCVDIQEMALWTALNWRLLNFSQVKAEYDRLDQDCAIPARRTLEDCLGRLCTRGLVASGTGATDFEALYDLLGGLYVAPLSESLPLRLATFLNLIFLKGVPFSKTWELFRRDRPNEQEAQVMALSRQALLSTAELIKCAEAGVQDISTDEKLMNALYNDDDTTSDNIADMILTAGSRERVTEAIANLYLRKQIIFERI